MTQKRKDAFVVLVKTVAGWGYTGVGGIWTPDLSTSEILATENIKTSFTVAKEVVNEQQSSL